SANSPSNRTSATSSPNSACATAQQPSCLHTTTESSNPDDLDAPPNKHGRLILAFQARTRLALPQCRRANRLDSVAATVSRVVLLTPTRWRTTDYTALDNRVLGATAE